MIVPDIIRKSIAFIGYSEISGKKYLAGTAFFVSRLIKGQDGLGYLVTAKHVIDKIRDKGLISLCIRLNFKNGSATWIDMNLSEWEFHPTDRSVDVAVARAPAGIQLAVDIDAYPMHRFATPAVVKQFEIGIGNEVFFPGLFVNHYGEQRNIPIVRVGNIAAMPEEKVVTKKYGPIDAYLVEVRSIGGLSGSPVFVHLGPIRLRNGELLRSGEDEGVFFLLGLMHGHFEAETLSEADAGTPIEDSAKERVNMGIGIVVPAEKIVEVIMQPKIQAEDARTIAEAENSRLPVADVAEAHLTKNDLE
ncbi:MAG TPA: hypothetical protein VKR43_09235 [Bryobacteraceae bacterium]|nr:hypothetical protein [Bryobacteraceae bacterium]